MFCGEELREWMVSNFKDCKIEGILEFHKYLVEHVVPILLLHGNGCASESELYSLDSFAQQWQKSEI